MKIIFKKLKDNLSLFGFPSSQPKDEMSFTSLPHTAAMKPTYLPLRMNSCIRITQRRAMTACSSAGSPHSKTVLCRRHQEHSN